MQDMEKLEATINAIESECNRQFAKIVDEHGIDAVLTALVNLGTGFVAKALVMTPRESRDSILMTVQMLIDSRTAEGDAVIESSRVIAQAMNTTCRPH